MNEVTQHRDISVGRAGEVVGRFHSLDERVTRVLHGVTLPVLRILLGVLFVWFGGLKVVGESPVGALVSGTLPFADPHLVVTTLGAVEVLLGVGLVSGVAVRLVLPVLAAHLTGTFLTFVMLPELMFRHGNLLLLTESGEFVAKNLVLVAATLVLLTHTSTAYAGSARARRSEYAKAA